MNVSPLLLRLIRAVGRRARWRAQAARTRASTEMLRLASPLTSLERGGALFYALASRAFDREQRAVLAGRQAYRRNHRLGRERFFLRRCVHMLEKGLSMRPRRNVFALDYIVDTVACFEALRAENGGCAGDSELQWANDVLTRYFEAVEDHPVVARARSQFRSEALGSSARSSGPGLAPYARKLDDPPAVEYGNLLALAERRRSVRWFEDRPVERATLERALVVASLSPSACNRQPFEFRIFTEREKAREVASIPMGTRGWVDNIPAFCVIVGTLGGFFSERDRHLIYTDGCLAAMSFIYALESLGLGTCCVNWPDIPERERAMADLLDLAPHERPVMCIAIGYADPAGLVPFSQKKETRHIARFN